LEFRPRKGDLKKIEIIQAAIDVLAHQGLENTTYEQIGIDTLKSES
jgi:AcrR family transcriptional regulator